MLNVNDVQVAIQNLAAIPDEIRQLILDFVTLANDQNISILSVSFIAILWSTSRAYYALSHAFGMAYGSGLLIIVALVLGKPFNFSFTLPYISSLVYLSVFGSIIAFGSYLTLIGNIGADKASYAIMVVPVVALILSSFFEGYHWSMLAVSGLVLVVAGNFLALGKKRSSTG